MSFTHSDTGTPEAEWRRMLAGRDLPALDLEGVTRLVLVAAHPDDETLGAGGLLHRAAQLGLPATIVVASLGEASHPDSLTHSRATLAQLRRRESAEASGLLHPGARLVFLGLPDGGLDQRQDELAEHLAGMLDADTLVVAPWRGDRHPDHQAAALAAETAASATGAQLLEYPIWLWHWGQADDVPWSLIAASPVGPAGAAAKREALSRHRSQVQPLSDRPGDEVLLHAGFLEHFDRPLELFVQAVSSPGAEQAGGAEAEQPDPAGGAQPDQSGSDRADWGGSARAYRAGSALADPRDWAHAERPDATGAASAHFDRMLERDPDPWRVESSWYERRKRAVLLASLPAERTRCTLELGCSTGVLSHELALRSDEFLGLDFSERAVDAARGRCRALPHARFEVAELPAAWPAGRFDLIVASELAYYLHGGELDELVRQCSDALEDHGALVICHWRHVLDGDEHPGDRVTAAFDAHPGLEALARHEEEDFVLVVLVHPPVASVARTEGMLGS
ncbi:bifunctional PIG-L family deacetylase/class I SAM-dependent methyltransferase [Herbiconiux sp. 11R-BC]|uniref:PIG-L family deacetylase n=1 Tax=Herbiconiux sp. 11R-BC TaxID=3111637 RepID=UPI003C110DC0